MIEISSKDLKRYKARQITTVALADQYDVSIERMRRHLKKIGEFIDSRDCSKNGIVLTEKEIEDYKNRVITAVDIAKKYGVTRQAISFKFKIMGIIIDRRTRITFTSDDIEKYKNDELFSSDLSKKYNASRLIINQHLKELGIFKDQRKAIMRRIFSNPEFLERHIKRSSERMKKFNADPEVKERNRKRVKEMFLKLHQNPEFAAAISKRASEQMTKLWQDPEFREKCTRRKQA